MVELPPDTKDWKVLRITLACPREFASRSHYKLRVEGENLNYKPEAPNRRFSWQLPDVSDRRFDLSEAKIEEAAKPYVS